MDNLNPNLNPNPSPNTEPGHKDDILKPIIAILVIAVLVIVGYFLYRGFGSLSDEVGLDSERSTEEQITRAEEGEIISNFPLELILEEGIGVSDSYSISYSGGNVSQPVLTYNSSLSLTENISLFGAYLDENNWTLVHEADASQPITFFYATRGNEVVNITFNNSGDQLGVNIAYSVSANSQVEEVEEQE